MKKKRLKEILMVLKPLAKSTKKLKNIICKKIVDEKKIKELTIEIFEYHKKFMQVISKNPVLNIEHKDTIVIREQLKLIKKLKKSNLSTLDNDDKLSFLRNIKKDINYLEKNQEELKKYINLLRFGFLIDLEK